MKKNIIHLIFVLLSSTLLSSFFMGGSTLLIFSLPNFYAWLGVLISLIFAVYIFSNFIEKEDPDIIQNIFLTKIALYVFNILLILVLGKDINNYFVKKYHNYIHVAEVVYEYDNVNDSDIELTSAMYYIKKSDYSEYKNHIKELSEEKEVEEYGAFTKYLGLVQSFEPKKIEFVWYEKIFISGFAYLLEVFLLNWFNISLSIIILVTNRKSRWLSKILSRWGVVKN